jgi:uncharacterized protein (DUF1330 family)
MSAAYVIGHISVLNEAKWAEYRQQVPATLAPWGGELVFRGALAEVLDGHHAHRDTVVIRFPDRAALAAWHASPAYQALIPLRRQAAAIDLLAFDAD